jgi:hypothetical protein
VQSALSAQRFFVGHTDLVHIIERSPDGHFLATAQQGATPVVRHRIASSAHQLISVIIIPSLTF